MEAVMTREAFAQQLDALHNATVALGSNVETAVKDAVQAFMTHDAALARRVIDGDAEINRMEMGILDDANTLLLLQAPVASDLRRILGVSRAIGDLERIGDYARDIARTTLRVASAPSIDGLVDLPALIDEVQRMLHEGVRCLAESNVDLARAVGAMDDQVDRSYTSLFQDLLGHMLADTTVITRGTYTLLVARALERIADHLTNVAEAVIYMVTAKMEELN
jgi:phosphate transport system protein